MRYCEYYCNRCHLRLVVKTLNETYIEGVLTCPADTQPTLPRSWVLTSPAAPPPLKWSSDISPCFLSCLVQFSLFTPLFFVSLLMSSLLNGQWWGIFWLFCCLALCHCLQLGLELQHVWPGKSWHLARRGGALPGRSCMQEVGCHREHTRLIDTSQTLPLALIGCVDPGAVDSCKSNCSHWVEPQTVDFYTADQYLIPLSDHNENSSKYNKKMLQTATLNKPNQTIAGREIYKY